ncbi:glycosyltransferase involved in cell wall biosynthesis [Pseudomonas fluvialis]|uniref:Glycosyltransferase involved in cell wall biosynthesis n=1 Tax=Pseudomonas fluvialis TaxID=1793966 RepID=A0A7X0ESS5_9PSED|nr:glycosyltransferase family 4 protein [Pseudomonas fluvialis]MBB6342872.1 glycosyltransferase involved in cell wall biosynthesis [Pseudomonas fluvialis]
MNQPINNDVCIFTIVSNNYLHYANTLFESLREHCPQADLVLGLCDKRIPETDCPAAGIIEITELSIPQLGTFIYQYSILELNTAIKPYIAELLMNRGYKKVIYFDPDIRIFDSLDPMLGLLDVHNVLLTPHLTDLLDDGKWPTELSILQAGSYNLGYIALRSCEETRKLVKWWQEKLYKECIVDLPRNLFVDQKWMDLVPSMFDGVYINRDPGWNVAYWNLNHRKLEQRRGDNFNVDGKPLTFFHFSGFSIEASTLSKHQNRFDKGPRNTPLRALCTRYEEALTRNGIERFKSLPYAFGNFADGTKVPDSARRLIRTSDVLGGVDFFDKQQCPHIHEVLNRLVHSKKGGISLTALALALWESRSDLREAFPAVESVDSIRFAEWLLDTAPREAAFCELYLKPIREQLERARTAIAPQPQAISSTVMSKLFRLVWQQRRRVPLKMRIALAPYAGWALRRAYPRPELLPIPERSGELGINLIGYLHAESGVGEAARASLRALRKSELPFSLVDYRLGNISRMDETVHGNGDQARYPINLVHVNADQSKIARDHLGDELFRDRYTIGYWYWEMPVFPDFLHFAYDQVDEIWVSTEYNRAAIAQFTHKPVILIPPAIEVNIEKPLTRSELHLDDKAFIFLHMSDTLSMPERKNPLGVIQAFQKAFSDRPELNVKLVIKLSNLECHPELAEKVYGAMEQDPRIQLIDGYLDRNTLNNLINACDSYVSLHRAEGFGLPIAEAMYLGKPVIATYWSGNVDLMNEENSLPVHYTVVEIERDIGPYKKGQFWAEPDIHDAAKKMLHIIANKELTDKLGKSASETIRDKFSPSNTAELIRDRIAKINLTEKQENND